MGIEKGKRRKKDAGWNLWCWLGFEYSVISGKAPNKASPGWFLDSRNESIAWCWYISEYPRGVAFFLPSFMAGEILQSWFSLLVIPLNGNI